MNQSEMNFDIIVAGGGPAGATAALHAARIGLKVCLLEKSQHPRFHIGESMLPQSYPIFQQLGLVEDLWKLPHVEKLGAEFILGDGDGGPAMFKFINGLIPGDLTLNIERSHFDELLLRHAQQAGALVREKCGVDEIVRLADGDVAVKIGEETITAKYFFDCTGQSTLLGRHLKVRKQFTEPDLQKVAYFAHFDHVERFPGKMSGYPSIVMCKEGWFWIIGLNETKTSIGFVTRPEFAKQVDVPADRLLAVAIARCPVLRHRMRHASGPAVDSGTNHVLANFSYRCRPYAGPGYFMIGDAAAFLDPIFSTGVLLAMRSGIEAVDQVKSILAGQISPATARRRYIRFFDNGTRVFWKLIRAFYRHSFRELFLNQEGPYQMHRAVSSILAGHVFPKPAWKLRWRLSAFHLSVFLQKYLPLVPSRKEFSLLDVQPQIFEPQIIEPQTTEPQTNESLTPEPLQAVAV